MFCFLFAIGLWDKKGAEVVECEDKRCNKLAFIIISMNMHARSPAIVCRWEYGGNGSYTWKLLFGKVIDLIFYTLMHMIPLGKLAKAKSWMMCSQQMSKHEFHRCYARRSYGDTWGASFVRCILSTVYGSGQRWLRLYCTSVSDCWQNTRTKKLVIKYTLDDPIAEHVKYSRASMLNDVLGNGISAMKAGGV